MARKEIANYESAQHRHPSLFTVISVRVSAIEPPTPISGAPLVSSRGDWTSHPPIAEPPGAEAEQRKRDSVDRAALLMLVPQ